MIDPAFDSITLVSTTKGSLLLEAEEAVAAIRQQAICTVERQRGRCWNGFPHKHLRPGVQLFARPAGPVSRSLHS